MLLSESYTHQMNAVSVRMLGMACTVIDKSWNAADVCTTYWRCYINEDAGARVRVGDTFYDITPGYVHVIPAWVTFSCLNAFEVRHFYSHFDLIGLPAAVVKSCFPAPARIPVDDITQHLFEELKKETREFSLHMGGCALVHHCLRLLITSMPLAEQDELSRHFSDPFNGLVAFLENNLSERLLNRDLARFCNMSEDYFIKKFKETMKVSPNQYVSERRVARAAERLIFSNDTIDSIAELCGFPNRHYFTRVFTRYMGLPPGQFRKSSHP